ncbi:hypothetical protein O1M63_52955 [Streptomyces mirabilis]|nr:hypothetical protein [Streptomyces mirabilis]
MAVRVRHRRRHPGAPGPTARGDRRPARRTAVRAARLGRRHRASTPLRRLQRRASGLDPRSSSTRLDHTPTRIAEVDDLAHTLQTVLARYDEQALRTAEALATARSFASAASHELRTPLMSMQTNLEILTEHPELAGPDRDEVLHDLSREHARLRGVLVMLRDLGRGDLVEADAFGPVDLADLVEASTEEQRRRHPHTGWPATAHRGCAYTAGRRDCGAWWTTCSSTPWSTGTRTGSPRRSR